MMTSSAEYDAFGPWVLPVSSPAQVPPVFRGHPVDFASAHDVLKVPRDVARRDVTPLSHLYDHLLVLTPEAFEVLTRRGHRYQRQRIARDAVVAVRCGTELLDGRLTVLGADGTAIAVRFNGASLPLVRALADRVAGWTDEPAAGTSERLRDDALPAADVGLANAYRALASGRDGLQVLTAYPGRAPAARGPAVHRIWTGPPRLSGAVVCADGDDLVVLSRRDWVRSSRLQDLSDFRTVVRAGRVTRVVSRRAPFLEGCTELTLHADAARLRLTVPTGETAAFTRTRTPA